MKFIKSAFLFLSIVLVSCLEKKEEQTYITSPDENIKVEFYLTDVGEPSYQVKFKNNSVIKTSSLGFDLKDLPSLKNDFLLVNSTVSSFNETWKMPWGEQLEVVNNYNELYVELQEK